jgi:cation diffusion facilitator CzcD-associated flavoprotein CzcO
LPFSYYKWPSIENLDKFKGKLVHSAAWDNEYSFEGKHVAIVGAGASAVQILPQLQPIAKSLTSFNRSKVWISAEFVDAYAPDGRNTKYSPEMIQRFNSDPEYLKEYRKLLTEKMCQIFNMFNLDHEVQRLAFTNNSASMRRRLGDREDLAELLIPEYPVGCRRTTPATGYLEALTQPNARVVRSAICEATEVGLVTVDGEKHNFDVIVAATGFDTSFKPVFPVVGVNGRNLGDDWSEIPKAYLSIAVPGYPNYFGNSLSMFSTLCLLPR